MKTLIRVAVAMLASVFMLAPVVWAQQERAVSPERVTPMFKALDTNGDGVISLEEFLNRPSEGAVSSPESRQHLEIRFRQLDSDGNGTLSPSELIGAGRRPT